MSALVMRPWWQSKIEQMEAGLRELREDRLFDADETHELALEDPTEAEPFAEVFARAMASVGIVRGRR
jgi:hypothetical protein